MVNNTEVGIDKETLTAKLYTDRMNYTEADQLFLEGSVLLSQFILRYE